jgi:hypothetical protein
VLIGPARLFSLLKAIYEWVEERTRQKGPTQSFGTTNSHHNPSLNTRSTNSNNQEREEIPTSTQEVNLEEISIHFLCTYSTHANWKQIVSTRNDYGQTLAHIAVTLGYFRLLQHLFRWQVDLNIVDSMGLSVLHYAYIFKQEECAKILIHSGVDRFILDDLGRSPVDLDPSLEVRLRSIMDMDMDNSADDAPPIEFDTEMPDDAGKLYAKHFLIQQWMREGEDERRGEVTPSKYQSQETSSQPALDSADESVRGVTYDGSPSLGTQTPEEHSTPAVAEEIDLGALIEIGTPPHITHPPSPICEVSPRTHEAYRPPDTGQNSFSHPGPLGGTINTPSLEVPQFLPRYLAQTEQSFVSTTGQGLLDTLGDVKEQNDANDGKLLQRSSSTPKRTRVNIPDLPRRKRRLPSAPHAFSSMDPTDATALCHIRNGVGQFVEDHPHEIEPFIGEAAATAIIGPNSRLGTCGESLYSVFFSSSHSGKPQFTCYDCGHVDARISRALRHQRQDHFGHYPYPCQGGAGHPAW